MLFELLAKTGLRISEALGLDWEDVEFGAQPRLRVRRQLFDAGKNIRQVCDFLGHADPAFTLRTYVHLIDGGLGEVDFLDAAVGNAGATEHPETAANDEIPILVESAG